MSHEDDQYDNEEFKRWLKGDDAVSRTYHDGDQPGPSAQLDAQILAQAAAATQTDSQLEKPVTKRPAWMLPLATAATLMVGVNLAVLVRDNTPDPSVESSVFMDNTALKQSAPIVSDMQADEFADAQANAITREEPEMAKDMSAEGRTMTSASSPSSKATIPVLTDSVQADAELGNDDSTNSNLTDSAVSRLDATRSADDNSMLAAQVPSNTEKKAIIREQEAREAVEVLRKYQEENQRRAAASDQSSSDQAPAEINVDVLLEQVRQGRSSEAGNADRLARFSQSNAQRNQASAADKTVNAGQEPLPTAAPHIPLSDNLMSPKIPPKPQPHDSRQLAQQETEAKQVKERANTLPAREDAKQELLPEVAQDRPNRIVEQLHDSSDVSFDASTSPATPAAAPPPPVAALRDNQADALEEIVVTGSRINRAAERDVPPQLGVSADAPEAQPIEVFYCVLDDFQITSEQIKQAHYDGLNQTPPRTILSWRAHIRDLAAKDDYRNACLELAAHEEVYPNTVFLDDFPVRLAPTDSK